MPHTEPTTEPTAQLRYRCRHILTSGHRCQAPCLRAEEFCYYHHTTRRPVLNPRQRRSRRATFELPNPEDRAAIQTSIGEVLRRIAANQLDPRRAGLLLYGLQIASSNLPKDPPRSANDSRDTYNTYDAYEIPQTVEDIVLDPAHGILAPRAECKAFVPEKGVIGRLMEDLGFDSPEDHPNPDLKPAVLPNLQAATTPREPHISSLRYGFSRNPQSPNLTPTTSRLCATSVRGVGYPSFPNHPTPGAPHLDSEMWALLQPQSPSLPLTRGRLCATSVGGYPAELPRSRPPQDLRRSLRRDIPLRPAQQLKPDHELPDRSRT